MNKVLRENEEPFAMSLDKMGSGVLSGVSELEVSSICLSGVRQGCLSSPLFFKYASVLK
jgi:hypothetical protein